MTKKKEPNTYKNIPVNPEIYDKVKLISEANGFGERGLGAQIAHWVGKALPECSHKKVPVQIEYFPTDTVLVSSVQRSAFYCSTCKRVYARADEAVEA